MHGHMDVELWGSVEARLCPEVRINYWLPDAPTV